MMPKQVFGNTYKIQNRGKSEISKLNPLNLKQTDVYLKKYISHITFY